MNKFGISEKNRLDLQEVIYKANAILRLCENSVTNTEKANQRLKLPGGEPFIQSCFDVSKKQKQEALIEFENLVSYFENKFQATLDFDTNAWRLDNPHPRPPRWPMGDMERQANRIRPAGQGHTGITGSLVLSAVAVGN